MTPIKKLFFTVCTVGTVFVFILIIEKHHFGKLEEKILFFHGTGNRTGFLVDTLGCQVPDFDPFDVSIRHLFEHVGPLQCPGPPSLVIFNRTHLSLNIGEARKQFGINAECYYSVIERDGDGKTDDKYKIGDRKILSENAVRIEDEFLKIECGVGWFSTSYTDFLAFIKVKSEVEIRSEKNFKKWKQETKSTVRERLNVAIIGMDSVSRLNMLRHMPKTYQYIKANMSAIELQGFVKVGDNTFVNVVPLLTGLFVEETWNDEMSDVSFNYLDLIWKNFSNNGYRTLYAEDYPEISAFNYLKKGFFHTPTDYYLRPFTLAVADSKVQEKNRFCYNSRPETNATLQWLMDYLITFQDKPTFSFLYNTRQSHAELNDVGYADDHYYNFFNLLNSKKTFNNSIVFFFSDHGIRFGPIRNTYVGKIEERMPFFFVMLPQWFPIKYPKLWENLKINQNRLTTFFDIYQTLQDLLHFTGESKTASLITRGISLFWEIPPERTCNDAAILPHWCTCHEKKSVAVTDMHVLNAAKEVVSQINTKLLIARSKCANLSVDKIVDARANGINEDILKFKDTDNSGFNRKVIYGARLPGVTEYLVTILVKPGGGFFEATVKFFEATNSYELLGDVSRINKYGNQSMCVDIAKLKKLCYCINNL